MTKKALQSMITREDAPGIAASHGKHERDNRAGLQ